MRLTRLENLGHWWLGGGNMAAMTFMVRGVGGGHWGFRSVFSLKKRFSKKKRIYKRKEHTRARDVINASRDPLDIETLMVGWW